LSISSGSRRGSNDAEDPGASVKAVDCLANTRAPASSVEAERRLPEEPLE